jgi:hypothetical protein
MTTTQGQLYFIALRSGERLEVQFVPDTLTIARNANYADIAVVGRNVPQMHYVGGTETITLKLDFFASQENRKDVKNKCNWLKSLAYRDATKPPEKVKLVFGELFSDNVWVVKSVNISYSLFNKSYGFLPQQAYVDITLALNPRQDITASKVRQGVNVITKNGKKFIG